MKKSLLNLSLLILSSVFLPQTAYTRDVTFRFGTSTNPNGETIEVDKHGFIFNGKHVLPVMGEIHYARVPENDWRREIRKMRAGGINIISTYTFWIHHEPVEGQWNWTGNFNLHKFLETCKEEQMPVVLRIGPFCHGEVIQGGFPTWLVRKAQDNPKEYKLRSEAPGFIAAVERLYANIYAQSYDMLWKNGGTVVGIQIENECRGPWSYYMCLKNIATQIGFDVPFYTRTGWPKLNGKEEFGQLLPLYGDYADGFWDRSMNDMPGDYPKAFVMKDNRMSSVIATETFSSAELNEEKGQSPSIYPYLTCELGGGMMTAYHRRINMSGSEIMPLAICKLGSGSNLPGYYMYHGGSNPSVEDFSKYGADAIDYETMAETQQTSVTNYNDMPLISYDFQSPLGEMGQPNQTAFHQTRWLHQFLADWGDTLCLMSVDTLTEKMSRRGCFEFYNDYVRILNEEGVSYIRPVNMPFCGHVITADVQPFCKIGNHIYFISIKGKKPSILVDGKKYKLNTDKTIKVGDIEITLLSNEMATRAYKIDDRLYYAERKGAILYKDGNNILEEWWQDAPNISIGYSKKHDATGCRAIPLGTQKVAAMPNNADYEKAALWEITFDKFEGLSDCFLSVNYNGDCARIYADGKLVEDNFWNGKPMLVRMTDIINKKIELRILPLQKDAPVYLQKEQRQILNQSQNQLLELKGITVVHRKTSRR